MNVQAANIASAEVLAHQTDSNYYREGPFEIQQQRSS
jgi:hypothetical protein